MKDANLKESKPIYLQTVDYPNSDEISLVDLTKALIKHKKTMIIVILLTLGLATISIFFKTKTYTYTTSIEIGSQIIDGNIKPIESPEALIAKIDNIYIPVTLREHRISNPDDTKIYKIKTSIPKNSLIIIMKIQGSEDQSNIIKSLLQDMNQKSIESQGIIYESIKRYTKSLLDKTNAELNLLKTTNGNETEIAQQLVLINTYTAQLATLSNTREILPVTKFIEPVGTSHALMLAIATITGVFLSIISAFFAEFISKVKEA